MTWQQKRAELDRPYTAEMQASRERQLARGVKPSGLAALMAWFLHEWSAEIPRKIHAGGVWRTTLRSDETPQREHVGGSLLGSPATATPFRRYIEERGTQCNEDGQYVFPMHAALARMAGRREGTRGDFMAHVLFAVGSSAGDIAGIAFRLGYVQPAMEILAESALHKVWSVWAPAPLPREVAAA